MSTPTSSIALIASGLTWVASVPALCASKRSPARWRSRPSAICERAELWVQRNSTLVRSPTSAAVTHRAPLLGSREQEIRGLAESFPGCLSIEGVEAPLPAPLLADQPRVLELPHVVGDLRLAHTEAVLELADADARVSLFSRHAEVGQVAAAASRGRRLGHHAEHPYPYGVRERSTQGYYALDLLLKDGLAHHRAIVLLDHAQRFVRHHLLPHRGLHCSHESAGGRHLPERLALLGGVQAVYRFGGVDVLDLHQDVLEARLLEQLLVLLLLQRP